MKQRSQRWVLVVIAASVGAGVGALAGVGWFALFAPPEAGDLGSDFQGVAEVFRGTVGGAIVGGLSAALMRPTRTPSEVALVLGGSLVSAGLFVVGLSYIGDLTNADGPATAWSYVGFAALPVSFVVVAGLVSQLRGSADGRHG